MGSTATFLRPALSGYLSSATAEIRQSLADYFAHKKERLREIGPWGPDLSLRLHEFAASGKLIRGALVLLAADLFRRDRDGEEIKLAASVELLQSALLIHDDIMDQDSVRRGAESVHAQYRRLGSALGVVEPARFGESLGICAADVAIFAAFEIIASLEVPGATLSALASMCSREMTCVGVAQMQDVTLGHSRRAASEEEVERLYLYKTGRYTFSLPLSLGALLAGAPERAVAALSRVGERLGLLFQLKDDEIGLFGGQEQSGKPTGSDVAGGKQTFYHLRLAARVSARERRHLERLRGDRRIDGRDIDYVRRLVTELGIRKELSTKMVHLAHEAHSLCDAIHGVSTGGLNLIHELIEYNLTRVR